MEGAPDDSEDVVVELLAFEDSMNRDPSFDDPGNSPIMVDPPRPAATPGPFCEFCSVDFPSFSALCKHQARPCHLEHEGQPIADPVTVRVAPQYAALAGVSELVVDRKMAEVTVRRLHAKLVGCFNLERYYKAIESLTSKSVWRPLSVADVQLMKRLCAVQLAASMGMGGRESQEEAKGREGLEDEIDLLIIQMGGEAFVKLSTRSPKDATSGSLAVTSGGAALQLLCKSQRCFRDLGMVERYGDGGQMSIIVRQFDPLMNPELEFRCVVLNRKLVTVSQYNCYKVFSALNNPQLLREIALCVQSALRTVEEALFALYESFVVDFSIRLDPMRASIVEINPPFSSGIGLFRWRDLPKRLTIRAAIAKDE